jgi:hypothetical protein
MTFSFHPEAEAELSAAVEYYEDREAGLGYDLSVQVLASIRNIVAHPAAWPVMEEGVRRCLVNRFPFGVLYSVEPTGVFVIAVMHLLRRPDHWKDR